LEFDFEVLSMSKTLTRLVFGLWIVASPLVMIGCSEGEHAPPVAPTATTEVTTPPAEPTPTTTTTPAPAPTEAPK
jgi:hypothetical protein